MAKYFITGVEIPIHEAYVLDVTEARRALRDLSNRIKAIEKRIVNFGARDSRIRPSFRSASRYLAGAR